MRIAERSGEATCSGLLTILSFLSLALVAGACGNESGGQTGAESGECTVVESVPIPVDEMSPLGFRAEDTLAFSEGEFADTMRWSDGSASPLTMTVARASEFATYLRSKYPKYEYLQYNKIQGLPLFISELKTKFKEVLDEIK